jgi:hypothetical protein
MGHVKRMETIRNGYKILVGNVKERDHLQYLDVDGE